MINKFSRVFRLRIFLNGPYAFLLLLILAGTSLRAQDFTQMTAFIKANSHWILGSGSGSAPYGLDIDFNPDPPVVAGDSLGLWEGITGRAAVSDTATGDLLFYTNTTKCFNSNYEIMPNGDSLTGMGLGGGLGHAGANQGACIVPMIDSPGKYYLFILKAHALGSVPSPLHYSIVDMSLDGGLGDIVPGRKNILLHEGPHHEGMIAIPGNNCDVWLLTHDYYLSKFRAYHITRYGLDTIPVESIAGPDMDGDSWPGYELGSMAVSPDRSTIALTAYGFYGCAMLGLVLPSFGLTLAKFNPDNGIVSDALKLSDTLAGWGAAFSGDNSKLYVNAIYYKDEEVPNLTGGGRSEIIQYDVSSFTAADIEASRYPVYSVPLSTPTQFFYLRRWKDAILTSYAFSNAEDDFPKYIASPDLAGAACDLHYDPYMWVSSYVYSGLGNDVAYPLPPDTTYAKALDTAVCPGVTLTLRPPPGFSAYLWDGGGTSDSLVTTEGVHWVLSADYCHSRVDTFIIRHKEDPAIDLGNDTIVCTAPPFTLTPLALKEHAALLWSGGGTGASIQVDSPGTYWVQSAIGDCIGRDTIDISFYHVRQNLGDDISVCQGDRVSIGLQAYVPEGAGVRWSNGALLPAVTVSDTGTYWVEVNLPPCTSSDTIGISFEKCGCLSSVPTAFTPNNDGLNDVFLPVIEAGCPVEEYMLSIYNRWGQRVFAGYAPQASWDGTYGGKPADAGTYMYELSFVGGTQRHRYTRKGDIHLLR